MSRSVIHTWRSQPLAVDDPLLDGDLDDACHEVDVSTIPMPVIRESLVTQQYVVYSATFQVPAFYFTIHNSSLWPLEILRYNFNCDVGGTPLTIDDLLRSTLFRPFAFEKTEASTFALTNPASSFPLLSQGDHPTLGTACWYLHPCESADAVGEIMREVQVAEELRLVRWLEAWFMILGTMVNFRSPSR